MIVKKNIIIALLFVIVFGGIAAHLAFFNQKTGDSAGNIGDGSEKSDLITVEMPKSNEVVVSPLEIRGKARGFWFFEASFPVKILDGNGNIIGQGVAQAQSDWMTEDFVPFSAKINFESAQTRNGILVLKKDNPSGLPENADELRVPIRFAAIAETMKVKVFFNNSESDPEFSCNKVFFVERAVPETQAIAGAALRELLSGPTQSEKDKGYFTSINEGVKIQSLSIENGVAKVDFDNQLEFQVGGSCRVSAIRAQITETLKQFSSVKEVVISVNGRTEDILQP